MASPHIGPSPTPTRGLRIAMPPRNAAEEIKVKKSWGDRFKMVKSPERSDPYLLQEYRDKYGSLSAGSALKKSMRYAEPWLYPNGVPNFCTCPDAISSSNRKSKPECSRCGGCRWPSMGGGTVRLPARPTSHTPMFGGTVRQSRSRPSIDSLVHNGDDPYDIMRRNRLTGRHPRAKSTSPVRASWPEEATHRKSILECEVNAYELIAKYLKNKPDDDVDDNLSDNEVESGVTISGQRIRMPTSTITRKNIQTSNIDDFVEDPEDDGRKQPKRPQRRAKAKIKSILKKPRDGESVEGGSATTAITRTTFESAFVSAPWQEEEAPPSLPTFAQFRAQRRKKQVQFNVVSDDEEAKGRPASSANFTSSVPSSNNNNNNKGTKSSAGGVSVLVTDRGKKEPPPRPPPPTTTLKNAPPIPVIINTKSTQQQKEQNKLTKDEQKTTTAETVTSLTSAVPRGGGSVTVSSLRRSLSDRESPGGERSTLFNDTMRLRSRVARPDARHLFANGPISSSSTITTTTSTTTTTTTTTTTATPIPTSPPPRKSRLISPTRVRPREPPPPPPPPQPEPTSYPSTAGCDLPLPPSRIPKPQRITVNQVPSSHSRNGSVTSMVSVTPIGTPEPEVTTSHRITFADIHKDDRPKSWMINGHPPCATTTTTTTAKTLLQVESKPAKTKKVLNVSQDSGHVCTIVTVHDHVNSPDIHRVKVTNPEPSPTSTIRIHQLNTPTSACDNNNKVTISVGGSPTPLYSNQRNSLVIPVSPEHATTVLVLEDALRDPVQAVRQNLVPHVCGRQQQREPLEGDVLEALEPLIQTAQIMDFESDFQDETTESLPEQMDNEMIEIIVQNNAENLYETIRETPIYEEIPDTPPPLPLSPPPSLVESHPGRSMFEGASKYDILSYLEDAKERVPVEEAYYTASSNDGDDDDTKRLESLELHCTHLHHHSDSSDDSCLLIGSDVNGTLIIGAITDDADAKNRKGSAEVERNDSGVGSETSKSSRARWQPVRAPSTASSTTSSTMSSTSTATVSLEEEETSCCSGLTESSSVDTITNATTSTTAGSTTTTTTASINPEQLLCEDCEQLVETQITESGVVFAPLVCRKCSKRRAERKEIIGEIVETEEKYGRDLEIILEEFYRPMLVAGLLTPEQLSAIFLNVEELLENQAQLLERLRDSLEIAVEQGDEDLLTVDVGKAFLDASQMLHAFESYCTRQGNASLLLANLEKEKELLRIFLRVSQMENPVLRRMNLNSFLMVPVQRVTKYPLLLSRLYKVTPAHHEARELLREAQHQIELHLEHMNSEAKDLSSTKLWRRISIMNGRRSNSELDMINIRIRKMALEILEWNHDEARFAMEGRLLFTNPTDNNWRRGRTIKLSPISALLVTKGKPTEDYRPSESLEEALMFPTKRTGVREATLLLVKEKQGRYSLLREPLYLDRCIVCCEADWEDYFEVQELASKDTFIFKAEDGERTKVWYRQIQYHAQGLGAWRKRRNALANIMINGMLTRN